MEAPQMRGVEEPLLPEPRAVEGGATQSEGAIETQEARYPRLHKTAGLRSLDVWVEISNTMLLGAMPFVVEALLWTTIALSAVFVMYVLLRRWLCGADSSPWQPVTPVSV